MTKKNSFKIFQKNSKNINVVSFVDSHGALVPEQVKKFLYEVKKMYIKLKLEHIFIIIVV